MDHWIGVFFSLYESKAFPNHHIPKNDSERSYKCCVNDEQGKIHKIMNKTLLNFIVQI